MYTSSILIREGHVNNKRQPYKMIKQAQTIRREIADNFL